MQYAVVIEKGAKSFGAYVPDLPGCVAIAKTRREVKKLIVEAIEFHLDGLRVSGERIPNRIKLQSPVGSKSA
ncbi:MAG: type II toxin-antitoxin system HicB family antitoxin [Candidatus Binataceae bacterium]